MCKYTYVCNTRMYVIYLYTHLLYQHKHIYIRFCFVLIWRRHLRYMYYVYVLYMPYPARQPHPGVYTLSDHFIFFLFGFLLSDYLAFYMYIEVWHTCFQIYIHIILRCMCVQKSYSKFNPCKCNGSDTFTVKWIHTFYSVVHICLSSAACLTASTGMHWRWRGD